MMNNFIKLGPSSVKHSTGYIVSLVKRYLMEYREDNHLMIIEIDDGKSLGIYKGTIKEWQPPYDNEIISKEKTEEIIRNIKDALNFLGIKYEFC